MIDRPTTLTDEAIREFEDHVDEFRDRINQSVERVLADVESDGLRNQLHALVFTANDALPKRSLRPTRRIPYLTEQLYLAHDPDGTAVEELLEFTIAVQEYYDIADDIMDGDVASGRESEVFVTRELLLPLVVRSLGRLGEDAVSYWSSHALRMVGFWIVEIENAPAADTYLDIVDRQSELFATVTGLSAIAAGETATAVERAESIGATYFKFDQFLLDLEQHANDDADPWNAWRLLDADEAFRYLSSWQDDLSDELEALPEERASRLRPLVAVDVETWHDDLRRDG